MRVFLEPVPAASNASAAATQSGDHRVNVFPVLRDQPHIDTQQHAHSNTDRSSHTATVIRPARPRGIRSAQPASPASTPRTQQLHTARTRSHAQANALLELGVALVDLPELRIAHALHLDDPRAAATPPPARCSPTGHGGSAEAERRCIQ